MDQIITDTLTNQINHTASNESADAISWGVTSRPAVALCFGLGARSGDSESSLMGMAFFLALTLVLVCLVLAFFKVTGFGILDNAQTLWGPLYTKNDWKHCQD